MKWTSEELILSWGYYKKFGSVKNTKNYLKHIEIFRNLQNRDFENAFNTFKLKNMNFVAYENREYHKAGNLEKSTLFKDTIISKNEQDVMTIYQHLISKIDDVKIPETPKKYKLQSNDVFDIDIASTREFENTKAKVNYSSLTISKYLERIKEGEYRVPLFQRNFVWSRQQIISFLNSLNKGYPFGNITIWEADHDILFERNKCVEAYREIGHKKSIYNKTKWILDGQQRTTSIISNLVTLKNFRKSNNIIYSFATNEFKSREKSDINFIYAFDLLNKNFSAKDIKRKYKIELPEAVDIDTILRKKILNISIGVTEVTKAEINTAIDIFTEMNTTGKRLSLFDIVNSKWHASEIDFDLEDYVDTWIKYDNRKYKPDQLTITKSIYLCFDKHNIKSKNIMKHIVTKKDIESMGIEGQVFKSLNKAHDFLINVLKFKPELMPSSNLIRFLTYAYNKNNNKEFTVSQNRSLKKYVKYVCIENMYSSSTDSKLEKNIKVMDLILDNKEINEIEGEKLNVDKEQILKLTYNEGSSFYIFTLNILFQHARSLENNEEVFATSSDKENSKINIHHIVPKSIVISNKKVEDIEYGNSIANLAPILAKENKSISNKYPKKYYQEYLVVNPGLDKTLKDMYIDPMYLKEIDGESKSNFLNNFWEERAEKIAKLINNS